MILFELDDDVLRELFDLPLWIDSLFEDGVFNPGNLSSMRPSSQHQIPKTVTVTHPEIPKNKLKIR